jgi:UDP-N-acetylmuramoylalanine--D-glutamate ligase
MVRGVIDELKQQYRGQKVLVVGLGLQGGGVGVAKFFAELGAQVTVTDKKTKEQLSQSIDILEHLPLTFHLGGHRLSDFLAADVIFKGPSVPWDLPEIFAAQKKGIPVEMDMAFFAKHCPAKIIGITGTRGKSTTTYLIDNILKKLGYPSYLGGSIPQISTLDYLKTLTANDFMVMEISSWALSGFHRKKISPHIAVFTNFYPDHLNYYKNMDEYLYDKKAIYLYQKPEDYLTVNKSLLSIIASSHPTGVQIPFTATDFPGELKFLKGEHNRENAAAALSVSKVLNLDEKKTIEVICSFKGLPFRQEVVGQKGKVTFINDTTSTTPTATIKAIKSFSDKPIYLILGGNSKNLPYDVLIDELNKIKKIILLAGSFTDEVLPILKNQFPDKSTQVYDDLKQAVIKAYELAKSEGGYVLFSPGATSFAMFNNEFERGAEFNKVVKKLYV